MAVSTIDPNGLNVGQLGGTRNLIINGGQVLDQRFSGASTSIDNTGKYVTDRWFVQDSTDGSLSAQQSTDAPNGFTNSLLVTVTGTDTSIGATQYARVFQPIEGLNTGHLNWGSSSASVVTLSFKVKCSVTGTFGGSFGNSAANRTYPFEYTINSANTWETKSITLTGDTTGTWLATNGIGIFLQWSFAAGSSLSGTAGSWAGANYLSATGATNLMATSSATWQITGVQLEVGDTATPFEHESYGTTLQKCLRYYEVVDLYEMVSSYIGSGKNEHYLTLFYKETKRASPTIGTASITNYQPGGGSGTAQIEGNALSTHCRIRTGSTNSSIPVQIINTPSANISIDAEL